MVSSKEKLEREGSEVNAPGQSSAKPAWPWVVVRLGYFLPCLIGICVWFYLQVVGIPGFKPMPLGWILGVIPILVIFSFLWVLPFVAVALVADRLPIAQTKYRGLVYGAFLGTALFEVLFFSDFWTNVEAIFLGFLVLPVVTFAGTLLGALFGLLVGWYFQPKKPTEVSAPRMQQLRNYALVPAKSRFRSLTDEWDWLRRNFATSFFPASVSTSGARFEVDPN